MRHWSSRKVTSMSIRTAASCCFTPGAATQLATTSVRSHVPADGRHREQLPMPLEELLEAGAGLSPRAQISRGQRRFAMIPTADRWSCWDRSRRTDAAKGENDRHPCLPSLPLDDLAEIARTALKGNIGKRR
jgi:hypothetical protein